MKFILVPFFAAMAYFLYPNGFLDIPIQWHTLEEICRLIGSIFFGILAIGVLLERNRL
jgi:hypothetical protein